MPTRGRSVPEWVFDVANLQRAADNLGMRGVPQTVRVEGDYVCASNGVVAIRWRLMPDQVAALPTVEDSDEFVHISNESVFPPPKATDVVVLINPLRLLELLQAASVDPQNGQCPAQVVIRIPSDEKRPLQLKFSNGVEAAIMRMVDV